MLVNFNVKKSFKALLACFAPSLVYFDSLIPVTKNPCLFLILKLIVNVIPSIEKVSFDENTCLTNISEATFTFRLIIALSIILRLASL